MDDNDQALLTTAQHPAVQAAWEQWWNKLVSKGAGSATVDEANLTAYQYRSRPAIVANLLDRLAAQAESTASLKDAVAYLLVGLRSIGDNTNDAFDARRNAHSLAHFAVTEWSLDFNPSDADKVRGIHEKVASLQERNAKLEAALKHADWLCCFGSWPGRDQKIGRQIGDAIRGALAEAAKP